MARAASGTARFATTETKQKSPPVKRHKPLPATPQKRRVTTRRWAILSGAAALALAGSDGVGGGLLAQENPNTFSLPESTPTPTPTPVPQGPLDERSGVLIRPRAIPPEPVLAQPPVSTTPAAPAPTPTPTSTPTPAATSAPAPGIGSAIPSAADADANTNAAGPDETPADLGAQIDALAGREPDSSAPSEGLVDEPGDARSEALDEAREIAERLRREGVEASERETSDGYLLGDGDWVDVSPAPQIDLGQGEYAAQLQRSTPPSGGFAFWMLGLLILVGTALGYTIWRMWAARERPLALPDESLARGVRNEMWSTYDKPAQAAGASTPSTPKRPAPKPPSQAARPERQEEPGREPQHERQENPLQEPRQEPKQAPPPTPARAAQPAPPDDGEAPKPPRLALSIQITSATRSVMQFALDLRLTIANRSDQAVRDLSVSAQLASAQRGGSNAPSFALGQALSDVARIGPQQSHTLAASLQLPMVDVRMLRQGSVPVFIPLLHVTIEGAGARARTTSFVIGTPSGSSKSRLHPIALDTAPGAIKGLLANPIKPFAPKAENGQPAQGA